MAPLINSSPIGTRPNLTGERIDPLQSPPLYLQQHVARYVFAASYCQGQLVLDAGCGMGYGAEFLKRSARRVIGIDCDPGTIEHCRATYQNSQTHEAKEGLTFRCLDAECLPQDWRETFNVVVAFEAIEHFPDAKRFLAGARDVLKTDGRLIVSTPNRAANPLTSNQFHVREFWPRQFERLLAECGFGKIEMYGQCPNPPWRVGLNTAFGAARKIISLFHRESLGIGGNIEANSHHAVPRPFAGEVIDPSLVSGEFMPQRLYGLPSFLVAVATRK
jgi:SAM-dependent methyltransferase